MAMEKKARKANFSHSEIMTLLESILDNRTVILSSLGTEITNKDKNRTWKEIAAKVSSTGAVSRTTDEVREKFYNLKRDHRARAAARQKSGNGAVVTKPTDWIMDLIIGRNSELIEGVNGGGHDLFKAKQPVTGSKQPVTGSKQPVTDRSNTFCDEGALNMISKDVTFSSGTFVDTHSVCNYQQNPLSGGTDEVQVQVHHPPQTFSWQPLDTSPALPQQQSDDDRGLETELEQVPPAYATAHEERLCSVPVEHPHQPKRQGATAKDETNGILKRPKESRLPKRKIRKMTETGESPLMTDYLNSCILLNQLQGENVKAQTELAKMKTELVKLKILERKKKVADDTAST